LLVAAGRLSLGPLAPPLVFEPKHRFGGGFRNSGVRRLRFSPPIEGLADAAGIGQIMVNAALKSALGVAPKAGVHDVRSLSMAVGLTAVFVLSGISSGFAASGYHPVNASYSSRSSNASSSSNTAPMSRADEPVPSNCIRQSCGQLWCWQMKNGGH
jgi:hypothetical protein